MVFDLHIIGRMVAIHDQYRSNPALWAAELIASARPVLGVCHYNGPDVTALFAGLDAIDTAIARNKARGYVVLSRLEDARAAEVTLLAAQVSAIIHKAKAIGEQKHDEEAAPAGNVTVLETRLRGSVAIGELPAHGGSK